MSTNLNDEEGRLSTFENASNLQVSIEDLAKYGFYHCGDDRIKCHRCGVVLNRKSLSRNNPKVEHFLESPRCPFIRGLMLLEDKTPVHEEYFDYEARVDTFETVRHDMAVSSCLMAQAGFYYRGIGDECRCFYCDVSISGRAVGSDPWTEHARRNANCYYLHVERGEQFIERVAGESRESPNVNFFECRLRDGDLSTCKSCRKDKRDVCFVPCGHVLVCCKCMRNVTKCAECGVDVSYKIRISFP